MLRLTLAALHLLALGIGLGAIWGRNRALRGALDTYGLRRVFSADTWWGLSAVLWLVTGLARLLMGADKATGYYLANPLFHAKMGLFVLILLLELWPMITLMRWRRQLARGAAVNTSAARRMAMIGAIEATVVVAMVFVAVALARGYGAAP